MIFLFCLNHMTTFSLSKILITVHNFILSLKNMNFFIDLFTSIFFFIYFVVVVELIILI